MKETGALKFQDERGEGELALFPGFAELNAARQELRQRGWLGVEESGLGFGNLSLRGGASASFFITGTGTGALHSLGLGDYAKVVATDFTRNWLRYEGRARPSAESLTHAAIYGVAPEVCVVAHAHDRRLWRSLQEQGPATNAAVAYGTPAMAWEVQRLFRETDVGERKIFAMAGHEDGIVAFGRNFEETLGALTAAARS